MKNNGHLVGFDSMPDLEESPMRPFEIMQENARLAARFDPAVRIKEYMEIVRRENEEREKIASKRRKIVKTRCKAR